MLRVHKVDTKKKCQPNQKQSSLKDFKFVKIFDDDFETDLAKLVVNDLLSPHLISKSATLNKWAKKAWGKNIPSSPHTIIKCVKELHQKTFDRIKGQILSSTSAPCLTADEWTSKNGKRYININVHADDRKYSLGLARIDKSANAENLSVILKDEVSKICSDKKIFFITTDGASVMKLMSKNSNLINQPCLLHGINLAICDVFYSKNCTRFETEALDVEIGNDEAEDFEQTNVEHFEENDNLNLLLTNILTLMKFYKYGNF